MPPDTPPAPLAPFAPAVTGTDSTLAPAPDLAPNLAADPAVRRFTALVNEALAQGHCERLVLTNYSGSEPQLQRVIARFIALRGQPHLSVVWRYATRDITRNLPLPDAVDAVLALCGMQGFRNAHLHTPGQEVQLALSKKGKASVRVGQVVGQVAGQASTQATQPTQATHNREKHRLLDLQRPFLRELGVTDAQGRLIPAMSRKWKQINKFIEVFSHALAASPWAPGALATPGAPPPGPLHVVDFGSGKGYLTFAIHDWLRHTLGLDAHVTGVELRDDMVALCQGVIDRLALRGMACEQGDVRHYQPQALHVMIALHACDVATDHAIHLGIRTGAQIIMCSPCCHKELRPQLLSPHPLKPILRHGIHLGQEAEMLTDGLRAMLLEAAGYDTQVFEFISLEHTNKNKMILAVKRPALSGMVDGSEPATAADVLGQIRDIKAFYGVQTQCLEALLRAGGLLPAEVAA